MSSMNVVIKKKAKTVNEAFSISNNEDMFERWAAILGDKDTYAEASVAMCREFTDQELAYLIAILLSDAGEHMNHSTLARALEKAFIRSSIRNQKKEEDK